MQFKNLIQKRRSVRKFVLGGKIPDWRKIIRAVDAARFIPAAGNRYNLHFVLVSDPDIISQIADACQQHFIAEAGYVVVCVSDEQELEGIYGDRGRRYTAQQAGAAIENFLLGLTEEGLATTWIGYFYDDMIKGLLNIPQDLVVEAVFPIGFEAGNASTKEVHKADLENVLYFDAWGKKEMTPQTRLPRESI